MNLNRQIIFYGDGISNEAVKKYFDLKHINYCNYKDTLIINKDALIIKAPGIRLKNSLLKYEICTDIGLYFHLFNPGKVIIITGTFGKTTLCEALNLYLKEKHFVLCGNIGIPIFNFCDDGYNLLIEASSFELEYAHNIFGNIYAITNLYPHHLDYHKTFRKYKNVKLKYLENNFNKCFLPHNVKIKLKKSNVEYFEDQNYNLFMNVSLNANYELFKKILDDLNIDIMTHFDELKNLHLENRLELIYHHDDFYVFNDSKATNPYATKKALEYIINHYLGFDIILILGGKKNKHELKQYKIFKNLPNVLIYSFGENKDVISKYLECFTFNSLEELINNINIKNKLVILFSPGAQSYDMFNNYLERGQKFNNLIFNKIFDKI